MAMTDYRQMTDAGTLRKQPQGWSGGVQPPHMRARKRRCASATRDGNRSSRKAYALRATRG